MASLNGDIVRERILERDLSEEILTVFTLNEVPMQYDLAKEGSVIGKIISILLPFFIIIYLFVNSMKVGLDTVAGEKERGTLAVTLVNQVSRLSIVIGKMMSVMIAAIVGAASSVIGLIIGSKYFMGMFGASGAAISSYSMSTLHILQFAIVIIPLAVLVAHAGLLRCHDNGNGNHADRRCASKVDAIDSHHQFSACSQGNIHTGCKLEQYHNGVYVQYRIISDSDIPDTEDVQQRKDTLQDIVINRWEQFHVIFYSTNSCLLNVIRDRTCNGSLRSCPGRGRSVENEFSLWC